MSDYAAKMDWALGFKRTGSFPLDLSTVFDSYADAVKYAAGDVSDPDSRGLCGSSYPGQVISVVTAESATVYKIKVDRSLEEVGRIPDTDGKSIEVQNGALQIKGFNAATAGQMLKVVNVGTEQEPVLQMQFFTPNRHIGDVDDMYEEIYGADGTGTTDGILKDITDLDANKADAATTLAGYGITDAYTKTEVDNKLKGAIHFKDTYNSFADLVAAVEAGTITPTVGDMYNIRTAGGTDVHGVAIKAGDNVIYVQTATDPAAYGWDNAGGTIDLSDYYDKDDVDNLLNDKVDKVTGSSLVEDTEITRLGTLEAISDPTAGDGNITLTNKNGTTREVNVYTLPTAGAELGGIKSTASMSGDTKVPNVVTVNPTTGAATVDYINPASLTGSVPEADKVGHTLTIGAKTFDGSGDTQILASDIPLPSNVAKTDVYGTAAVGGTVKSSDAQDKVAIGVDGLMTLNDISASKIKGVVGEASKVSNKLKIGTVEYDGSAAQEVTKSVLEGILTDMVKQSDYATTSVGGTIKSTASMNGSTKVTNVVSVDAQGKATVDYVAGNTVEGAVDSANKLGGIAATDILKADGSNNLTSKVKNAAAADALATPIDLTVTGDVAGEAQNVDGSSDVTLNLTLAEILTIASGDSVTATKVTVNKKGQVTAVDNLAASDIPTLTLAKISDAGAMAAKDAVAATDFDTTTKAAWDSLLLNEHTHSNKTILDGIGETQINLWNTVSNKADAATTLAGYGITDAYTKTEVDGMLTGAFHYKDSYASFAALTAAVADGTIDSIAVGDVYNIQTAGGTDRHGVAIKAGDNVVVASVTGDAAPYTVTWDVLSGTVDLAAYATQQWVTSNFAGLTDFNSLKEEVMGADGTGTTSGLKKVVGDSASGLVKDVNDLKTTVGDASAGLVKKVTDLETTVGDATSGLVKDVDDLQTTVERLDGAVGVTGSVKQQINALSEEIQAAGTGTIDVRIAAHNTANNAHSDLFAAKQNKAITTSATFAVADFVANTDTSVAAAYMATKAIGALNSAKNYWCDLAVDGQSITAAISAKFVPVNKVDGGSLTVYANAIPSAAVTVNGKFTEIQA